ncbi:O-antigen ligase family protein [Pontibacter ruber]|uniref:O-antigen ligase family protein n=1 Tax=Pontibacter ruber TaxID=1343895 RepID=A0ABW5CVX6_9BACT|nr:O-antigen ligase family protein [Pontibacter ruber]
MKLKYNFLFAIPLILFFVTDNMFTELAAPHNLEAQGALNNMMVKALAGISFLYSAVYFMRMSPPMRIAFFFTTLYVLGMVFESYYKYNTPMVYPHVFLKVLLLYYSFAIYTYYKGSFYVEFSHIAWFALIGFWLNVLIVNPHTLSVSSFTNHERGVHSTSVYMLVLPFLYFLSNYFFKGKLMSLLLAFFVLVTIFFFQHRTVWISTAVVLVIYYLLFKFKTNTPLDLSKILPIITVLVIAGLASSAFIFSIHPEIIEKIQESFSDMENFDSQGTGGWRYKQWLSYLPFIQENFFFGMRFEGFELPIQFYREDLDKPVFEDGHGHFFHSFYVDVLFYTGLAGLVLYCLQAVYATVNGLRKKSLTVNQIMLLSFIMSGFIFGISYVLPVFFYAVLGWAIATLEVDKVERSNFLVEAAHRRKYRLQALRNNLIIP